jgi:hypothetical protein
MFDRRRPAYLATWVRMKVVHIHPRAITKEAGHEKAYHKIRWIGCP